MKDISEPIMQYDKNIMFILDALFLFFMFIYVMFLYIIHILIINIKKILTKLQNSVIIILQNKERK